jgi:predicted flap endonuclease-1-like 5' DNA nuclease
VSYPVREIEGIGPKFEEKLHSAGIKTTEELLDACRTPGQRARLADSAEVRPDLILTFANRADLMRIRGVGGQFAELLNEAGVDTVRELARRNPDNLHAKLVEVNEARPICKTVPGAGQVARFVEEAKTMDPRLEY